MTLKTTEFYVTYGQDGEVYFDMTTFLAAMRGEAAELIKEDRSAEAKRLYWFADFCQSLIYIAAANRA